MVKRRFLLVVAALTLGVVLLGVWQSGIGPFRALWPSKTHTPIAYRVPPGAEIQIGVAWSDPEYTFGTVQFTVKETADSIIVSQGIEAHPPLPLLQSGAFYGVGVSGTAWDTLLLAAPVGTRKVIRESDGASLELRPGH